jgi:hypothetical protein
MRRLGVILVDIAALELARDGLPVHSHIASLFALTLQRLRDEAEAVRRVQLKRAA